VRLEADVVIGKAVELAAADVVLVDADVVAAATTHMARKLLHAPWLTLLAPPSLTMTTVSTPTLSLTMRCLLTLTLWPPPRTRRRRLCTRRGAHYWRRRC